ncbi:LuxR C-terminal-related transcriptional regulator [Lentilitoribacter sp. EG35]|uniref:LuxR C-terminal-related transcriptional regulator n=1 Tax=Lentilitoribacter sp. EG35 TaxID=3234192 RepID=UPI003461764E
MESELILDIYDATLDPEQWPGILHRLAELIDARGAFVFDVENRYGQEVLNATYFSSNYQADLVRQYLVEYRLLELEDQALFARHSRELDHVELVRDDVLAPSRDELMKRANAAAMRDFGIFYRMGGLLNKDRISADRFALQFSEKSSFPSGERLRILNRVLPHIAKALNIGRHTSRLNQKSDLLSKGYDQLRVGVALLDRRGELLFSNTEFQRQMDCYGAFQLTAENRLVARLDKENERLSRLFSDINAHGLFGARPRKEALLQPLAHHENALCIEVCPLKEPNFMNGETLNGYAIFSLDTSLDIDIDTEGMARFFSLTPTEAEVLELLTLGLTNSEISEQRERSRETVNTQVKCVLQKTMSSNRTQLMRLALQYSNQIIIKENDEQSIPQSGDDGVLKGS